MIIPLKMDTPTHKIILKTLRQKNIPSLMWVGIKLITKTKIKK